LPSTQRPRARTGNLTGGPHDSRAHGVRARGATGDIRVIDLPRPFAGIPDHRAAPDWTMRGRDDESSRYDELGRLGTEATLVLVEHPGTHFDRRSRIFRKDLPNNAVYDHVAAVHRAGCLDRCSEGVRSRPGDFALTIPFVERWEARHGKIEPAKLGRRRTTGRSRPIRIIRTCALWRSHSGASPSVVKWFVDPRRADSHGDIGTDFGHGAALQSARSRPFLLHGKASLGQCLTNLICFAQAPSSIAAPLRFKQGRQPVRVLALVRENGFGKDFAVVTADQPHRREIAGRCWRRAYRSFRLLGASPVTSLWDYTLESRSHRSLFAERAVRRSCSLPVFSHIVPNAYKRAGACCRLTEELPRFMHCISRASPSCRLCLPREAITCAVSS